nr:uncharacterized protein LOC128686755 [Cherax quadricarinatus]
MKSSHVVLALLLGMILSISATSASSDRWVWESQRSGRQIDPSREPSTLPRLAPAGVSSLLAPSVSSLRSPRTPATFSPSFSVPSLGPLVSSARVLPQQETISFPSLPIDISTLPLETSDPREAIDSFGHPPPELVLPTSDDLVQELSEDDLRSRLQSYDFGRTKTLRVSDLARGTPSLSKQSQTGQLKALVSTPDISQLPLQTSSPSSFSEGITGFQVAVPSSGEARRFQHLSTERVTFPQKLFNVDTSGARSSLLAQLQHERHQKQLAMTSPPPSATSVPTQRFLQPTLGDLPLRDGGEEGIRLFNALQALQKVSSVPNTKKFELSIQNLKQKPEENNLETSFSIPVIFPEDIQNFRTNEDKSPVKVVDPPLFGASQVGTDFSGMFPALSPSQTAGILRPSRSTVFERTEPTKYKSFSLFIKKPLGLERKKNVPSYTWVWPDTTSNIRLEELFNDPAIHAL